MVDIAFRYDYIWQEWVASEDAELLQKEIEELPHVLVMEFSHQEEPRQLWHNGRRGDPHDGRYVFCWKHRCLEKIADVGREFISAEGCRFSGLVAMGRVKTDGYWAHWNPSTVYVPFRWRLFQREPGKPLNISGDVAVVRPFNDGLRMYWRTVAYSVHIARRRLVITRPEILEAWQSPADGDIPEPVVTASMRILQRDTELDCGIKPSVLSRMGGHRRIASYIERPFDLNIVYLKTFLREFIGKEFHIVFPYEAKDNYRKICSLLEIHPPKSLRRAYTFNPYAVVWYMYLQQWGICDINLMQPFFGLCERIVNMPLHCFYYSREEKQVRFMHDEEVFRSDWHIKEHWEEAEFYGRWLLEQGREKKFLRWLREVSEGAELKSWQWDLLRAFRNYHEDLSEQVKKRLLREGLTRYLHDVVSKEVTTKSYGWDNVVIEYPAAILGYECNINRYEFRLVKETVDLAHIGRMLGNCVASYRQSVLDRKSIIVYARYEGEYVACIELQKENHLVQALGKHNCRLAGELLLVCRVWAKHCRLMMDVDHLSLAKAAENGEALQDLRKDEVVLEEHFWPPTEHIRQED